MGSFAGLNLMDTTQMGADYGRWLIHGPQGAGKSTLASTIAEAGPTLYIDLIGEKGTRSFWGSPYAANIRVVRPASITALDDVFWALAKGGHPFKAVVIDSLTAQQKMTMRFLLGHDETAVKEITQGTAPASFQTWGQSLDIMTDTATHWFGLADSDRTQPMHVVMVAQTKITEDEEKNIARTPDVQKGALSILLASPDYIVYCDTEQNIESVSDPTKPSVNHIVRFGADPKYRIKARLPQHLWGRIPPVLGRSGQTSLVTLSRVLGIGGVPPAPAPAEPAAVPETVTAAPATTSTTEEQTHE